MSDKQEQYGDLQNSLARVLDFQNNSAADQGNTLVLLSLVNLMGIVNILEKRGFKSTPSSAAAGSPPVDMGALLQMLGPVLGMNKPGQQSNAGAPNANQNPLGMLMNLLGNSNNLANLAPLLGMLGGQGNQNMNLEKLMKQFNELTGAKPPVNEVEAVDGTGEKAAQPVKEVGEDAGETKPDKTRVVVKKRK